MVRRFFNSETGIWRFFGWVGEIVSLSLMWVVCSLPLITLGAASTALYDATAHCVRQHETDLFSRFFGTFRREWKTASLTTLLWGLLAVRITFVYRLLAADGETVTAYSVGFLLLLFFILGILSWCFPLLSRFTFGFAALNRTALRMAAGNILGSTAMALLFSGSIFLVLRNYFSVLFVPGLAAWLCSFLIEPVFARYTKQSCER